MNGLSLFAGIGGLDLGLERAGVTCVGQVEIDPYCQQILAKHWPHVPRHDDVTTAAQWWLNGEDRPHVDVVFGGFPCQPSSQVGLKLAQADERWMWPEFAAVIAAVRPAYVLAENVPGLRTRGLDIVLADLDRLGYVARAGLASACSVGAPHTRERVFTLAHAAGQGRGTGRHDGGGPRATGDADHERAQPARGAWWAVEPGVGRVAYGIPTRVDQCRTLGNAVVPHVAEWMGRLLMSMEAAA